MRVKVIIGLLPATEDGASRLKLSALRNKSQPSSGTILMTVWTQGTFYFTNSLLVSIVNFSGLIGNVVFQALQESEVK